MKTLDPGKPKTTAAWSRPKAVSRTVLEMDAAHPDQRTLEESEGTERKKGRVEQLIENVATGLGDGIGFLADKGILFVVFAIIWIAFGVGLVASQGSLDTAWQWVRDLPWVAQGLVWLLFLPVMISLWIWET